MGHRSLTDARPISDNFGCFIKRSRNSKKYRIVAGLTGPFIYKLSTEYYTTNRYLDGHNATPDSMIESIHLSNKVDKSANWAAVDTTSSNDVSNGIALISSHKGVDTFASIVSKSTVKIWQIVHNSSWKYVSTLTLKNKLNKTMPISNICAVKGRLLAYSSTLSAVWLVDAKSGLLS